MHRRKLLGLVGGAAMALGAGLGAGAASAQEVTLRLQHFLPPQANVPRLVLDVWADKVEAGSGGRIKVERYPSMQLGGKPPELMDQIVDGAIDIGWTVVGYTPGRFPSTEVFELPFMVGDARAASYAYWKMYEEHMKDTEFKDVYMQAWDMGCKGCTTYRPNAVTGSVLSVSQERPVAADRLKASRKAKGLSRAELADMVGMSQPHVSRLESGASVSVDIVNRLAVALDVEPSWLLFGGHGAPEVIAHDDAEPRTPHGDVIYMSEPLDRPQALEGNTYKLKWPDSEHAIYITINDIVLGGHRRPFEVFINSKNMEHFAWTVALTRMISAVFRRGGDVSFVVEELKAVFDPRGGHWMNGRYVPSLLAAIGGVIEEHMRATGFLDGNAPPVQLGETARSAGTCPRCSQQTLLHHEGCLSCTSCDYSRCQ